MNADIWTTQLELRTPPLRQAALTLHALAQDDQMWLMAQLSQAERSALSPMLDELRELGITCQPELVAYALCNEPALDGADDHSADVMGEVQDTEAYSSQQTAPHLEPSPIELLSQVNVTDLLKVVRHEAPVLVARLIQMHPWPWSQDLLDGISPPMRLMVEACLIQLREALDAENPVALNHALCVAVLKRMPARPSFENSGTETHVETRQDQPSRRTSWWPRFGRPHMRAQRP